ncbi:MAG: hypothetical protein CFE39_14585 [Comamonadaceae bacterium PBBC2]|nr:MAG: hypothetical protein CFE39_14585 [Comamonadaceae bacterium PBBC2]
MFRLTFSQLMSRLACYMYKPSATGSYDCGSTQLGMVASSTVAHAHWPAATHSTAPRLKINVRPQSAQN